MAKAATTHNPRNQSQRRKEEARRRSQQRQRQRLLTRIGALGAVMLGLTVGIWWYASSDASGDASGQVLHQFDTNDFHSLAVDPDDADTFYFGHHGGLMISTDGGETWEDTSLTGVDAMQLAVPAGDSDRMYAAGHDVFSVSTDGGKTWRSQSNNLPGLDLHAFAGSPSDPLRLYTVPAGQGIFTSADGGETWDPITIPPGGERAPIALAVAPDDPLHVYAGVGNRVAESTDGGKTWREMTGPSGTVVALAVAPDDPSQLYAGTVDGLFERMPDGSWQQLPVETAGAVLAVAVSQSTSERLVVIDQQGNLYRSDNGGEIWGRD